MASPTVYQTPAGAGPASVTTFWTGEQKRSDHGDRSPHAAHPGELDPRHQPRAGPGDRQAKAEVEDDPRDQAPGPGGADTAPRRDPVRRLRPAGEGDRRRVPAPVARDEEGPDPAGDGRELREADPEPPDPRARR